jgi:hypothetical protein
LRQRWQPSAVASAGRPAMVKAARSQMSISTVMGQSVSNEHMIAVAQLVAAASDLGTLMFDPWSFAWCAGSASIYRC